MRAVFFFHSVSFFVVVVLFISLRHQRSTKHTNSEHLVKILTV